MNQECSAYRNVVCVRY